MLLVAHRFVRFLGEVREEVEECLALPVKQARIGEELHRRGCRYTWEFNGSDHRAFRQVLADEGAWSRHHLALRKLLVGAEIGKDQTVAAVNRNGVAGFVVPNRKVDRFASANAFEYFECEKAGCLQAHGCIETCAPLLDHREMECGGVGYRLNLIVGVAVMQWNAGPVYDVDDLRKRVAEIGIARASITRVPTRVHVEMH